MIPEIKRILYTTDLSPNSAYAFRYAINSAKKHDASIVILHVVEEIVAFEELTPFFKEARLKMLSEEKITNVMERIRKRLQIICDKELKDDPEFADRVVSIEVCKGFPPEQILRKVDELNCDVIIMGNHGKGVIKHSFLGSSVQKVLRRVRKPIFIIPLPEGETEITFHDI